MDWANIETIERLLGPLMSHQVTQFGLAFAIAAWLHSGRVKKEIKAQADQISAAFNNLAEALRNDLKSLNDRVSALEKRGKDV